MALGRTGRRRERLVAAVISWTLLMLAAGVATGSAQDTTRVWEVDDRLTLRFVEADLRAVVHALGRYLDKPLVVADLPATPVTLETPTPIPKLHIRQVLEGLARAHNLVFSEDAALYHLRPIGNARTRGQQEGDTTAAPLELAVIRLKHARAADVAATVDRLFGGVGAFAGSAGLSQGTLSDELRRDTERTLQPENATQGGSGNAGAGLSAALGGPVTMVPDLLTNSLLVRASAEDFAVIEAAVQQLDLRPLQVLIQVLIVEARKDHAFALGLEVKAGNIDVGDEATLSGFLSGGGLGTFALQVMKIGSFELEATLQAAVARGDAKIVSRPVVVASNNREARILVGSQQPFVQVSRSLPTDLPSRDQVVQYRDVGTKLTVLPTINPDGYVSLFIRQEVSTATSEVQFNAPVIATREAETEVLVRDGQTVVMGGLREQQEVVSKSGIPILSDIPILGGLFGVQQRTSVETELFLFITPTVLRDDAEADAAAAEALEDTRRMGIEPERTRRENR